MNRLFFLLLLLVGCGQKSNKEGILYNQPKDSEPKQLFDQTYPKNLSSINYYDIVPKEVRENLPFGIEYGFNADSVKIQNTHIIESLHFDGPDTTKGRLEFDKFGNLMYQKIASHFEGMYYRYLFDDNGRLVKRFQFQENKELYRSDYFQYNDKGQVLLVIVTTPEYIDSIPFEYDDSGNMIRAGQKTLKYDNDGNCIEWNLDIGPHCGNTVTHWTGKYDKNGNLIESKSNAISSDFGGKIYDFKYFREYSHESGKLLTKKVYEGKTLLTIEHYYYYK